MDNGQLIESIEMKCPLCGRTHNVEKRIRTSQVLIKDEPVVYQQVYYYCSNLADSDICEFVPAGVLDENLLAARNEYRKKHGLLTSNEIVALRSKYGLTQSEFALILGCGEVTISRFETKAIQTQAFDSLIRIAENDAQHFLAMLDERKDSFSTQRFIEIRRAIVCANGEKGGIVSTQTIVVEKDTCFVNKHYVSYFKFSEQSDSAYSISPQVHYNLTNSAKCYVGDGEITSMMIPAA